MKSFVFEILLDLEKEFNVDMQSRATKKFAEFGYNNALIVEKSPKAEFATKLTMTVEGENSIEAKKKIEDYLHDLARTNFEHFTLIEIHLASVGEPNEEKTDVPDGYYVDSDGELVKE